MDRSQRSQSGLEHFFAQKPEWAEKCRSWPLVYAGFSRVGKQAAILVFLFYQICSWNPSNHYLLMSCRRDLLGAWVYPCEATKAITRCFPLFAASLILIVTGRYILQHRIYYLMLLKGVLLDFTNYNVKKDIVLMTLFLGFLCSLLHFVLAFFFPPYLTLENATLITSLYLVPCFVFFLLMQEASDVEWSTVPLAKFVEVDPAWAKKHIAQCKMLTDGCVRYHIPEAMKRLHDQKQDGRFDLEELLDEIIRLSQARPLEDDEATHSMFMTNYSMWPARILLSPHLKDKKSIRFRKAFMTYTAVVAVILCGSVVALAISATQAGMDAVPGGLSYDAFYVGGVAFERVGVDGYCRDADMHRPPGYLKAIESLSNKRLGTNAALLTRSSFMRSRILIPENGILTKGVPEDESEQGQKLCALHCARREKCIGFAMDPEFCNIYLNGAFGTPSGWMPLTDRRLKENADRENWSIAMADSSLSTTCFVKVEEKEEPEKFLACAVYVVHIFGIMGIVAWYTYRTWHNYFVPVSKIKQRRESSQEI